MHAADPDAFADTVFQKAGTGHHIWLVWQPMYQTYGVKCETIATDLLTASTKDGGGGRNVVTSHEALYYEPMNLTEYVDLGTLTDGPGDRADRAGGGRGRRPIARGGPGRRGSGRRPWGRLPESLREALLPFVVARVVVAGTLGLAHFIVDRTHPATPGVAARVHAGLLGWDAGWYETIAREGYGPLGRQSLRFFPAVPLLTHALAWVPGLGDGPALVLLANAAALAATAMLYVLVRRETGDAAVARRSLWILSLLPAAFVLVMGYAESVLLVLAIGCFLALRPPAGKAPPPVRTSSWPGCSPSRRP